jgi:regulator of sigma E protease
MQMDGLVGLFGGPLTYILAFLFVLSIVVFFHELGHFLVARWCGVTVKAFSIGFGREIAGFDDKHGTRWKLCWIPLGGYVKFMDDEGPASTPSRGAIEAMTPQERAGAFHAKPLWQRAAVVAAGPAANFLLALVIFTLWFWGYGVRMTEARVDAVLPDGPAARAGVLPGDRILAIEGRPIDSFEQLQKVVMTNVGRSLAFDIERQGALVKLQIAPEVRPYIDEMGDKTTRVVIGISHVPTEQTIRFHNPGLLEAAGLAVDRTAFIVTSSLGYLSDVIVGRQSGDQLGGPIRIADVAGRVAGQGWENLIHLTAFISVSIGLINLFPIPLLDGGHLLFYAIEAVRRKPLDERTQEMGFRLGLAVVLGLFIFVTINDLPILKRWLIGPV